MTHCILLTHKYHMLIFRVVVARGLYLYGHQVMEDGTKTTATVMVTPTQFGHSVSHQPQVARDFKEVIHISF